MPQTKTEWQNAMSYISRVSPIIAAGESFQDNDAQKLWDETYVGELRVSRVDITPSQQALDQALINYNIENEFEASNKLSIKTEINAYDLDEETASLALHLLGDIVKAYLIGQNPNIHVIYLKFSERLIGSNLQTPIVRYVTTMTGLSDFSPTISKSDKQTIIGSAITFLQSIQHIQMWKRMTA